VGELRDYGTPMDADGVTSLRRLIPAKQPEDTRIPYPYQKNVDAAQRISSRCRSPKTFCRPDRDAHRLR